MHALRVAPDLFRKWWEFDLKMTARDYVREGWLLPSRCVLLPVFLGRTHLNLVPAGGIEPPT